MSTELRVEGRVLAQKYRVERLIGQGGMGAVYEARNHLNKRFAVKLLLRSELTHNQEFVTRFFREAQASSAIESDHIVQVFDTGVDHETGYPFIIMELLSGDDLEKRIQTVGPLNTVAATRIHAQAALGLAKAHDAAIVHRDIKPANIFLNQKDSGERIVKILDFGIAKQVGNPLASSEGAHLTKTGSMMGTPLYMSPEQARGLKTVDARSDVWSLGMCLYESLIGRKPWGGIETLGDLILSICSKDIENVRTLAPWVPEALAMVVHKALQREQSMRFASAREFADALLPFCQGSTALLPDLVYGIDEHSRAMSAPSVLRASQNSTTAGTVQTYHPFNETTPKKRSRVLPVVLSVFVLGGGTAALFAWRSSQHKVTSQAAPVQANVGASTSVTSHTTVAATTSVVPSASEPIIKPPVMKSGDVTLKVPPGCVVKVNNKPVSLHGQKISLSGHVEQSFIVTVFKGSKAIANEKVFMSENGPVPDEIDAMGDVVTTKSNHKKTDSTSAQTTAPTVQPTQVAPPLKLSPVPEPVKTAKPKAEEDYQ